MRSHKLSLDTLEVVTFEPISQPVIGAPLGALNDEWTGCDSACSGCGQICANQLAV